MSIENQTSKELPPDATRAFEQIKDALDTLRENILLGTVSAAPEGWADKEDVLNTLRIAQKENRELKENYDKEVADGISEEISRRMAGLNSIRNSEMLDSVAITCGLIRGVDPNTIPSGERHLYMIPGIVLGALKSLGLEPIYPIEKLNEPISLTVQELIDQGVQYFGPQHGDADEEITVLFKTPGWTIFWMERLNTWAFYSALQMAENKP